MLHKFLPEIHPRTFPDHRVIGYEIAVSKIYNGVTVAGHCDVLTSDTVWDYKTTARFTYDKEVYGTYLDQALLYAHLLGVERAAIAVIHWPRLETITCYEADVNNDYEPVLERALFLAHLLGLDEDAADQIIDGYTAEYKWECTHCIMRNECKWRL